MTDSTPISEEVPQAHPCKVSRWFTQEVQQHEPALRAYLRGRFPDLRDIDDVVQETYIRVLRLKEHGSVRSPKAFLIATARNLAVDVFRKRNATPVDSLAILDDFPVVEDRNGSVGAFSHEQELQLLDEAVQNLPEKCRQIIILKKIEGLSYEEIELRLGISRNTISAQLTIGVMKCRDYLLAQGVMRAGKT